MRTLRFFPGVDRASQDLDSLFIATDSLLSHYQEYPTFKLLEREEIVKIQSPAENLPLFDSSVDVIVYQNVLDHVADPQGAIKEMARVLKPEGMILLAVHTVPSALNFFMFRNLVAKVDINHPHHFNDNKVIGLVEEVGTRVISKKPIKLSVDHPCSAIDLVKPGIINCLWLQG